jgi:hypothetical protein
MEDTQLGEDRIQQLIFLTAVMNLHASIKDVNFMNCIVTVNYSRTKIIHYELLVVQIFPTQMACRNRIQKLNCSYVT